MSISCLACAVQKSQAIFVERYIMLYVSKGQIRTKEQIRLVITYYTITWFFVRSPVKDTYDLIAIVLTWLENLHLYSSIGTRNEINKISRIQKSAFVQGKNILEISTSKEPCDFAINRTQWSTSRVFYQHQRQLEHRKKFLHRWMIQLTNELPTFEFYRPYTWKNYAYSTFHLVKAKLTPYIWNFEYAQTTHNNEADQAFSTLFWRIYVT